MSEHRPSIIRHIVILFPSARKYIAQLEAENERLRVAFDAMHKHRYDSECSVCNSIVDALKEGK